MARTKAEWETERGVPVIRVVRGPVSATDVDYAIEKLTHAARVAGGPVLQLEVRMTQHQDPARVVRAYVEMSADINGRPTRAHAAAPTMHEAIDAAAQRFTQHIERLRDRAAATHERLADSSTWHHGQALERRPRGYFERPADERELRRRKVFVLPTETIDGAVFDLEVMDHDFFMFRTLDTDEVNVVARAGEGYRLFQPHPDASAAVDVVAPVIVDPAHAPVCSVADARLLLDLEVAETNHGPRMVFFIDGDDGVPAIVYRRRDGHDGLIQASM